MYQLIDLPVDSPIMGLRIQKDIKDSENLELVDLIRQRVRRYGPVRLLLVYEADLGLMGAESLYDNMRFAKQASENLAKMAVIGKHDWESTWIGLFGLFGGIKTAYYDHSQIKEALGWLAEP
jgi:hypothetical protein